MDRTAIQIALQEIAAHPDVVHVAEPIDDGGRIRVEFDLDLQFPSRWVAEGQSPTGVLPVERVRLDFSRDYPSRAPQPSLRPDFNPNHAHFQPGFKIDGRPVPCLVFGDLNEFVAARGMLGLVEQFRLWLERAARDALAEGDHWEPMRRDAVRDSIVCDADEIRTYFREKAGFTFVRTIYRRQLVDRKSGLTHLYRGRLAKRVNLGGSAREYLGQHPTADHLELGLALVLYGNAQVAGEDVVHSVFMPDDVTDLASFQVQMARFGVADQFRRAMTKLAATADEDLKGIAPMPVILLARRPKSLPDSESTIELIVYFLQIYMPSADPLDGEVRPVACQDYARPTLLRRLAGAGPGEAWALLGAGSLGSKIALHQARSGNAPLYTADHAYLRPHNGARHALYPPPDNGPLAGWLELKAPALAHAIAGLGQSTREVVGDHQDLAGVLAEPDAPSVRWIVNTTGSTIAREWLAGPAAPDAARIIEAGLFDRGDLGFIAIEGENRNPDCAELMGAIYAKAWRSSPLGARIFADEAQDTFVPIGQGCGSATMVMSDAHLSAMAAPMTEIIASSSERGAAGELHLLSRSQHSLSHQVERFSPFTRVPLEGLDGWSVSLSPDAVAAIDAEIADYPHVETGGVLVGWASAISRRLDVLATLAAPPDSVRSAHEFVLGVEDLSDELTRIADRTAGVLVCLGTWHSHLGPATPSARDWASAAVLGSREPRPMTLLIRGVGGFRAISTLAAASQAVRLDPGSS